MCLSGSVMCVYVSVRVPKTDNFTTTSHFAFTWGWIHSGMSVRARVSVRGFPSYPYLPPLRRRRAVRSSLKLILVVGELNLLILCS